MAQRSTTTQGYEAYEATVPASSDARETWALSGGQARSLPVGGAAHPAVKQRFGVPPLVFGVLNVTPDSFSDGGCHATVESAVAHGLALAESGADVIDVGGESTRPGAARVPASVEASRVLPVVQALAARGVRTSIDTTRAAVAARAVDAGAEIVNDVTAGRNDPAMARVVAQLGCPWILMHSRGSSVDMAQRTSYPHVVDTVLSELATSVAAAEAAGVSRDNLILDPGLGFAKRPEHNWELLHHLDVLVGFGLPVLVGASRKSFLGRLLGTTAGQRPVDQREHATTAITTFAALHGAWAVRVHDARAAADALATVRAIAGPPASSD